MSKSSETLQQNTPAAKPEALSPRDALYATVKSYRDLKPNYDGDGANPPEQNDVNNMLSFIDHIPDSAIDSVRPIAAKYDSGFLWDKPGKHYLELIFDEGEITFYGKLGDRRYKGTVDYDENAVPEKLKQFLFDLFPGQD